ncbi:MAG: hypothetical protein K5662_01170 [Lachnospiraceae bacterium]|nr:hypothetical protein [Lachnospiraceae bacterium]
MKKRLARLLVACACVLSLCACGSETNGGNAVLNEVAGSEEVQAETESVETDSATAEVESVEEGEKEITVELPDPTSYDEYLTDEDGNPLVGYNIPLVYHVEPSKKTTSVTLAVGQNWEISISYYEIKDDYLQREFPQKDDESETTELTSYNSPIGEFRIFNKEYIQDDYMGKQFAIMELGRNHALKVEYGTKTASNYRTYTYSTYSMEYLLDTLFGQRGMEVSIPDDYDYYLTTDKGVNEIGVYMDAKYEYEAPFPDYMKNIKIHTNNGFIMITPCNYSERDVYLGKNNETFRDSSVTMTDEKSGEDVTYVNWTKETYTECGEIITRIGIVKNYDVLDEGVMSSQSNPNGDEFSYTTNAGMICVNDRYFVIHNSTDKPMEEIAVELFGE